MRWVVLVRQLSLPHRSIIPRHFDASRHKLIYDANSYRNLLYESANLTRRAVLTRHVDQLQQRNAPPTCS